MNGASAGDEQLVLSSHPASRLAALLASLLVSLLASLDKVLSMHAYVAFFSIYIISVNQA